MLRHKVNLGIKLIVILISILAELVKLDNKLDELNLALNDIEQKNDAIHAKLLKLLQDNREIRKQFQNSHFSSSVE